MNSQKLPISGTLFESRTYAGVMQDKRTPPRSNVASGESYNATTPALERPMTTNSQRIQKDNPALERPKHHGSDKRQLVPVTGCIPRFINDQLERMREQGGKQKLSKSSVVANIIVRGVQRNVDMQYGVTLEPVIEHTINKAINQSVRSDIKRAGNLALEAFYSAEESRIVSVYILRFLLGDNIELLPQIIKDCQEQARENVSRALHEGREGKEQN